ncbi:MAG: TerC family protein [Alphaproteobacteria bacterium]
MESVAFNVDFLVSLLEIIGVNIILSGDNAVVIALACRSLPRRRQRWGIALGSAAAVVLRIIFTVFVVYLMTVPYLKLAGGALLFWIGYQVLQPSEDEAKVNAADHVFGAVRTILIADAVMSLDNVIAIAAAAHGNHLLLILGLIISVPMVVYGATLLIRAIERFPVIIYFGAGLIGYIGGEVAIGDPAVAPWLDSHAHWSHVAAPLAGAALVLAIGRLGQMRARDASA